MNWPAEIARTTLPDLVVTLPTGATVVFARCVGDVFRLGYLTITKADTDEEIETLPPGEWTSAVAIDCDGDEIATYRPLGVYQTRQSA